MFSVLIRYLNNFKTEVSMKTILKLAVAVFLVLLVTSFLILEFEGTKQFKDFGDALWWSVVTATTVGYGDKYPVTAEGRIIAFILMLLGIGSFGAITAKLANIFISIKQRRELGELEADYDNHLIICGWSKAGREVIEQSLREEENTQIVLVTDKIEKDPYPNDERIHFVKGGIDDEETLKKAGIMKASKAIILNEDDNDKTTVLSVLTIESINPSIYTLAEVKEKQNEVHFANADVDEIIIKDEINSQLLVRSAFYEGTSRVVEELLSNQYGDEIYMEDIKEDYIGEEFVEVMYDYKKKTDKTLIGLKKGEKLITNPNGSEIIEENTEIIFLAKDN